MVLSFKTISSAHANPAKTELEYTSDRTQHQEITYKQDMIGMIGMIDMIDMIDMISMIDSEVQIHG